MAKELLISTTTGITVYFHLFNSVGQIWNTAGTPAFQNYATANIADYDIAGTEAGTASGYYTGDMPAAAAGVYSVTAKQRVGGAPAETDPTLGAGVIEWDGSAVVSLTSRATQTSVNTVDDFLDTEIAAIKTKTDQLTFSTANRVDCQVFGMEANVVTATAIAGDAIGASELAGDAVAEIAGAVWDVSIAAHVVAGTFGGAVRGLVLQYGTIGATGNDSTHLHLDGLTYGDDEINNYLLVIFDNSASEYHARFITDWADTGDLATVATLPFTPEASVDKYWLLSTQAADAGSLTAAEVADAVWDEATAGHTTSGTFGEQCKTDIDDILTDTGTTLQGELDGIQADTEDIQSRLPAGLVGGRMDASVGAMAANVITAAAIANGAIDAATFAADVDAEILSYLVDDATRIDASALNTASVTIGADGAGLTAINLPNQTMDIVGNITGNLSGSVGSVTGSVGGNVTGSVGSVVGAVGSVTGNVGGNVTGSVGSVAGNVGGTINGLTATALKDFFDTDSTTTYASAVAGSVVKEIADNAGGASLTVADIADGVWDEILSGHLGAGSAGEALGAAGTAGDPWTTALPGAYGAGTAGFIIGTNLNATVGSRSSHSAADVWASVARTLTAGTNIVLAKGTGVTGFNDLSAAQVNTEADAALADVGLTTTVTDRIDAAITSRMASYTQPTGFLSATFPTTVASPTNITGGTITTVTTVTNLTNAPTAGDFTATMKTSLNQATPVVTISGTTGTLDALQTALSSAHGSGSWATATGFSTLTAADVWAAGSRTLTAFSFTVLATVSDKTGYSLAAGGMDAVVVETGLNARQALSIIAATSVGKVSGAGTGTESFVAAVEGSTVRVIATVTAVGNRTAITYNLPS